MKNDAVKHRGQRAGMKNNGGKWIKEIGKKETVDCEEKWGSWSVKNNLNAKRLLNMLYLTKQKQFSCFCKAPALAIARFTTKENYHETILPKMEGNEAQTSATPDVTLVFPLE